MNKKGFISTSVVYAFFLIILLILLFIVSNLVNNRILLNRFKDEVKEELSSDNLARYLVSHGEELGLVYHDNTLSNGAHDNSYRFVGSNPNNYICFGSSSTSCPSNNLYRIIGIIDGNIKVIKNTSVGNLAYNSTANNNYSLSSIYVYLNDTFLQTFTDQWRNAIVTSNWSIGGFSSTYMSNNAFNIYNVEVGDEKITNDVSANVGLMYVSDYAYATVTSNYNGVVSGNENWLNNGANSWFITRLSNNTRDAYYLRSNGNIANSVTTSAYQIRPTFYLNGRQKYAGGNGTQANPYRIEV